MNAFATAVSTLGVRVAVIGGGVSGLTGALELRRLGYDVDLYEQLAHIGGRAQVIEEEGLRFDLGPSWYWMPKTFETIFSRFGARPETFYNLTRLDPAYRLFVPNEKNPVDVPGAGVMEWTTQREPRLDAFWSEARDKNAVSQHWMWKRLTSWFDFLTEPSALGWLAKWDVFTSLGVHMDRFTRDDLTRLLLSWPTLFLGVHPERAMALYSFMTYAGHEEGTFYPSGGMSAPTNALATLAREAGVRVHVNHTVRAFETQGPIGRRRVAKVCFQEYDAECAQVDAVLATADYAHVDLDLLDAHERAHTATYWLRRRYSPACLLFFLGVDRHLERLRHHNFFFESFDPNGAFSADAFDPDKPTFYVTAPSRTDPDTIVDSKRHKDALYILVPFPYDLNGTDSGKIADAVLSAVLARLKRDMGAFKVTHKRRFGSSEFSTWFNAFRGNAFGLSNEMSQSLLFKPEMTSSRIVNLAFAGHSTHPGPGVPPSMISGVLASQALHERISAEGRVSISTIVSAAALSLILWAAWGLRAPSWRISRRLLSASVTFTDHGKTYSFGALLLGWRRFFLTAAIYDMMRHADDIVDCQECVSTRRSAIEEYVRRFFVAWAAPVYDDIEDEFVAVIYAIRTVGLTKRSVFERFFEAMKSDAAGCTVQMNTMEDLLAYMDGSAAVVGEVMLSVFGCTAPSQATVEAAQSLGLAFQLTNFVRDIDEDRRMKRQYVPMDICRAHSVFSLGPHAQRGEHFEGLMERLLQINSRYYDAAEAGISSLPPLPQLAIRAALEMYREIDNQVRRRKYRVFDGRVSLSTADKLRILRRHVGTSSMLVVMCRAFCHMLLRLIFMCRRILAVVAVGCALSALPDSPPFRYRDAHARFATPPLMLLVGMRRHIAPIEWGALLALIAVAVGYTLPWDAHMIAVGAWEYTDNALKPVFGVPTDELFFFVSATLVSFLAWRTTRIKHTCTLKPSVRSVTTSTTLLCIGCTCILAMPDSSSMWYYILSLVAWTAFPLTCQVFFGMETLLRAKRRLMEAVAAASVYLLCIEWYGIRRNIWMVNTSIGAIGIVPLEEVLFYVITSAMSIGGFELFANSIETWRAGDKKTADPMQVVRRTLDNVVYDVESRKHIEDIVAYNVYGGRSTRSELVSACVRHLSNNTFGSDAVVHIGMAVEVWHAFLLVIDDIMDNAAIRRDKPAWHTLVPRAQSINDGLLLQAAAYNLLAQAGLTEAAFSGCCRAFFRVQTLTGVGQHLDLQAVPVENMKMERFERIAMLKTGLYTFYLPIVLALCACEVPIDEDTLDLLEQTSFNAGILYQMRDDYCDAFSEQNKTPCDIEEGRCTWFVAKAVELADDDQKRSLAREYNTPDGRSAVVDIYESLGLRDEFVREFMSRKAALVHMIETLPILQKVLLDMLERLAC